MVARDGTRSDMEFLCRHRRGLLKEQGATTVNIPDTVRLQLVLRNTQLFMRTLIEAGAELPTRRCSFGCHAINDLGMAGWRISLDGFFRRAARRQIECTVNGIPASGQACRRLEKSPYWAINVRQTGWFPYTGTVDTTIAAPGSKLGCRATSFECSLPTRRRRPAHAFAQ